MKTATITLKGLWTRAEYDAAAFLLGEAGPALKESITFFTKAGEAMDLRLEDEELSGVLLLDEPIPEAEIEALHDALRSQPLESFLDVGQFLEIREGASYMQDTSLESVFIEKVFLYTYEGVQQWKECDGEMIVPNTAGLKPSTPDFIIYQRGIK